MESINIMCAAGYPVSEPAAAHMVAFRVKAVAFQRGRITATGVTVPQIADLPSVLSAKTSKLRT